MGWHHQSALLKPVTANQSLIKLKAIKAKTGTDRRIEEKEVKAGVMARARKTELAPAAKGLKVLSGKGRTVIPRTLRAQIPVKNR